MFEIAFSFRGRLGRLPFFLGSLALGVAAVVGLVALAAGVGVAAKRHEWGAVVLLCVALLPLAVAGLWCSLSLHVRRIRDIGWDPAVVIGEATPAR